MLVRPRGCPVRSAPVTLEPGALIAGQYQLETVLGQGGMGVVWAAVHSLTHKRVALKILKGPTHLRPELRRRFLREARAVSSIAHPNVVAVHDVIELEDGTPVMVMDLLEGETLGQRLERDGAMDLAETAMLLLPVVSAVGAAHAAGIVHRDLKPDNVYLGRARTGGPDVRVLDFGIAKLMTPDGLSADPSLVTAMGAMLGTPCYMSPEQAFGEKSVDLRADVWAIGVLLYECLTGARPVDGESPGRVLTRLRTCAITPVEALRPELPAEVTVLIGRMLSREREGRPEDLREVLAVLRRYSSVSVPDFG